MGEGQEQSVLGCEFYEVFVEEAAVGGDLVDNFDVLRLHYLLFGIKDDFFYEVFLD